MLVASSSGSTAVAVSVVAIAVLAFYIVTSWKIFTKANRPGWASLIPIYNTIVQLQIIGRPIWWWFLLLIPFVNIVVLIIVALDVAKVFGKGTGFGILLILLPVIALPILAFGSAKYQGPIQR